MACRAGSENARQDESGDIIEIMVLLGGSDVFSCTSGYLGYFWGVSIFVVYFWGTNKKSCTYGWFIQIIFFQNRVLLVLPRATVKRILQRTKSLLIDQDACSLDKGGHFLRSFTQDPNRKAVPLLECFTILNESKDSWGHYLFAFQLPRAIERML